MSTQARIDYEQRRKAFFLYELKQKENELAKAMASAPSYTLKIKAEQCQYIRDVLTLLMREEKG